jgi:hypothetical protein
MQLYLSEADHDNVANLDLDDTVRMTVVGKVTSISRPTEMDPMSDGEGIRATLDIAIEKMEVKEVDLQEALSRAGEKHLRLATEPAP